jgi:hypothetical protein
MAISTNPSASNHRRGRTSAQISGNAWNTGVFFAFFAGFVTGVEAMVY